MKEVAHSCSAGWPRGLGFVVPVIQQHHLGVLCDPSGEQGDRRAQMVSEEALGSEYNE